MIGLGVKAFPVKTLELDGTTWNTADDVYSAYFLAVKAPKWHGRNLDAVWDGIVGGNINRVEAPFRLRIRGSSKWPVEVTQFVNRLKSLFGAAKRAGVIVDLEVVS